MLIRLLIALIVIIFVFIYVYRFFLIDGCLDLGGRWDYALWLCEY